MAVVLRPDEQISRNIENKRVCAVDKPMTGKPMYADGATMAHGGLGTNQTSNIKNQRPHL